MEKLIEILKATSYNTTFISIKRNYREKIYQIEKEEIEKQMQNLLAFYNENYNDSDVQDEYECLMHELDRLEYMNGIKYHEVKSRILREDGNCNIDFNSFPNAADEDTKNLLKKYGLEYPKVDKENDSEEKIDEDLYNFKLMIDKLDITDFEKTRLKSAAIYLNLYSLMQTEIYNSKYFNIEDVSKIMMSV